MNHEALLLGKVAPLSDEWQLERIWSGQWDGRPAPMRLCRECGQEFVPAYEQCRMCSPACRAQPMRRYQFAYYLKNRERIRQYGRRYYLLNSDRILEAQARERVAWPTPLSFDHGWHDGTQYDRNEYDYFQRAVSRVRERSAARDKLHDLLPVLAADERALMARLLEDGLDNLTTEERALFAAIQRKARQEAATCDPAP